MFELTNAEKTRILRQTFHLPLVVQKDHVEAIWQSFSKLQKELSCFDLDPFSHVKWYRDSRKIWHRHWCLFRSCFRSRFPHTVSTALGSKLGDLKSLLTSQKWRTKSRYYSNAEICKETVNHEFSLSSRRSIPTELHGCRSPSTVSHRVPICSIQIPRMKHASVRSRWVDWRK